MTFSSRSVSLATCCIGALDTAPRKFTPSGRGTQSARSISAGLNGFRSFLAQKHMIVRRAKLAECEAENQRLTDKIRNGVLGKLRE
jgi:hypothetical protein